MTDCEKEAEKIEKYAEILRNVDEKERGRVDGLIRELVHCEIEMEALRAMPFIAQHPTNPARKKITPAARLYHNLSATYANGIRILLNVLRKVESDAQDELLRKLEEFHL